MLFTDIGTFKIYKISNILYIDIKYFIVAPPKPHFDVPRCTIHVDIYCTVPVLFTALFLKIRSRVRNMYI